MTITNHWGVWVDSEVPTMGVIQNNHISQFISDEMYGGINLTYEDALQEFLGNSRGITRENRMEKFNEEWEDDGQDTWLLGDWKKVDGLYEPDKTGEYAVICGEIYSQVVWSKTTTRGPLCSPCQPGQVDLSDEGSDEGQLSYTLPADCFDINI